ncbi:MAG: cysteine desulfurase family protein [Candidatus Nucleicultricaceae bacterium]
MKRIYLDYNANAPLYEKALHSMIEASSRVGSASSVHCFGREARKILEDARRQIATTISSRQEEVIFTSGASEANTMALQGYKSLGADVWVSAVEHASVYNVCDDAKTLSVDSLGRLCLDSLTRNLQEKSPDQHVAVCVMAANNETGVIQPIQEIADLCQTYGAWFHCDAVQALGRIPLDFKALKADTLVISAHKIGGPIGIGALVVREGLPIPALIRGAGQERGRRAGTQNHVLAAGFAAALDCVMKEDWGHVALLREYLESKLLDSEPALLIFGRDARRLSNTSAFIMPGVKNEVQVMGFDLEGFAVSAGSACSSGTLKPSRVLKAMGVLDDVAETAIRVSLTPSIQQTDIDEFVKAWNRIKQRAHALKSFEEK